MGGEGPGFWDRVGKGQGGTLRLQGSPETISSTGNGAGQGVQEVAKRHWERGDWPLPGAGARVWGAPLGAPFCKSHEALPGAGRRDKE